MWKTIVACGLAAAGLAGCGKPTPPAPAGGGVIMSPPTPARPVNVLVAQELGSLGTKLVERLGSSSSVIRLEQATAPLSQLAEKAKTNTDMVLAIGPNDLIPLDQAGLLAPGGSAVIATAPLLLVVPAGKTQPADLAALATGKGKLGLPNESAGHAAELAGRLVAKQAPKLAAARLVVAPIADLLAQLGSGGLAAAVLPAYALIDHQDQVTVQATLDAASLQVIAVAVNGSSGERNTAPALAAMSHGVLRPVLAGTPLVAAEPKVAADEKAKELFVYAGAGIRAPLEAAAKEFTDLTGIPIRYNYTGSACLLAQITMSQEGDLYIPGEDYYMDQAKERGYTKEPKTIAYFVPVIATQKGNPKGVHSLADLAKPGLRVGVGEPKSCAVGSFTVKVLQKNSLYDQVEHNVTMRTPMAPELGNALKLGSIDACVNWDAVAAWYEDASTIVPIDPDQNMVSGITGAVLTFSTQAEPAQQYLDFLAGDQGRAIFEAQHYTVDPAQPIYPAGKGA